MVGDVRMRTVRAQRLDHRPNIVRIRCGGRRRRIDVPPAAPSAVRHATYRPGRIRSGEAGLLGESPPVVRPDRSGVVRGRIDGQAVVASVPDEVVHEGAYRGRSDAATVPVGVDRDVDACVLVLRGELLRALDEPDRVPVDLDRERRRVGGRLEHLVELLRRIAPPPREGGMRKDAVKGGGVFLTR